MIELLTKFPCRRFACTSRLVGKKQKSENVIGTSSNNPITAKNHLKPELFPLMALPINPIEEKLTEIQTELGPSKALLPALDVNVAGT